MKIFILFFILLLSGCSKVNEPNVETPEIVLPSIPEGDNVEDDIIEESNSMHELLINYVFIDVVNIYTITLPSTILNEEITWFNEDEEVDKLSGNNITYNLEAKIGSTSKEFVVTFSNGIVNSISQQDLNFNYLFVNDTRKLGTSMNPDTIVLHNTGNSAAARNEVLYLNSSSNTSSTSFHFAVDDTDIYQAVRTNVYAHHAGDLNVNKKSIGIEIAKSTSTDNNVKDKAIANGIKLIKLLQMQYDIDNVITHKDVTGKHCPHDIIDRYGLDLFYKQLEESYYIM